MNTATLIKEHRLERQLTQKQLAAEVFADAITISRWERGATTPSDLYRVRLARVFGIHPNDLLSEDAA
jgi:transcriptional regulator with XRE-family HTH domain